MLTPTKEKTWSGVYNYSVNSGVLLTDVNAVDYAIVESLLSSGCTCVMSSNRTNYGPSLYINSIADWVRVYSGIGSWIVLNLPSIGSGTFQLLIAANSDGGTYYGTKFVVSPGGNFTGGNLTSLPTAIDSIQVSANSNHNAPGHSTGRKYVNVLWSSDNKNIRIAVLQGGKCCFFAMIETLKSPPANIAAVDNWHAWVSVDGCFTIEDKPIIASMWSSSAQGKGYYTATSLVLAHYHTGPSVNGGHLGNLVTVPLPEQSVAGTTWPAWPIGIAAYNISGSPSFVYEERGQLYDIAWGCASQVTGSTYDSAGSKSWVKMGDLWIPWDGSAPMIS